jgi:hypothetical protein
MIDSSDSNKFCGSKFYSKSLIHLVPILEMINQGFILKQISDTLGIKQPHVSYYIKRAKEFGYITESHRDRFKIIKLTQPGLNFLDQYGNKVHNKQGASCRAENVRFSAPVYGLPPKPPDWSRVEMNNWSQYNSMVDNIKVKLNMGKSPTIEFIPSPLDGKSPGELCGILYYECNGAARKVEQMLDMKIGRLAIESRAE